MRKILAVFVILVMAGCQTYREDGARTPGEFADDVGIQARVKAVLVRDAEVKGLAINVEVSRSIVTLYGRVPSNYARNKAVQLAGDVRGVVDVVDKLTLVQTE